MAQINVTILTKLNQNPSNVKARVQMAAKMMNLNVQIRHSTNFGEFANHAINPALTPIIIINNSVEYSGRVPEMEVLKKKLFEISQAETF